jgi:hypothetical protein
VGAWGERRESPSEKQLAARSQARLGQAARTGRTGLPGTKARVGRAWLDRLDWWV